MLTLFLTDSTEFNSLDVSVKPVDPMAVVRRPCPLPIEEPVFLDSTGSVWFERNVRLMNPPAHFRRFIQTLHLATAGLHFFGGPIYVGS